MAKKKKLKVSANYLDYVPKLVPENKLECDEKGQITILMENKGFFNAIAKKFFRMPETTTVHLDELGNFVIGQIDGVHTVNDIAEAVKAKFGESAEPLYNRLVTYMETLRNNNFIYFDEENKDKKRKK